METTGTLVPASSWEPVVAATLSAKVVPAATSIVPKREPSFGSALTMTLPASTDIVPVAVKLPPMVSVPAPVLEVLPGPLMEPVQARSFGVLSWKFVPARTLTMPPVMEERLPGLNWTAPAMMSMRPVDQPVVVLITRVPAPSFSKPPTPAMGRLNSRVPLSTLMAREPSAPMLIPEVLRRESPLIWRTPPSILVAPE